MTSYRLRAEGIAWQQVENEIVCLDLVTSRYLSVNATGAVIWPLLVEGSDTEDLELRLVSAFDIDRAAAARDVALFIGDLSARGLVEQV